MDIVKLTSHINALTNEEKHVFIKDMALNVNNNHKRMQKALNSEKNAHVHSSRAKSTTLYANAQKAADSYNGAVEMLKLAISIAL